MSYKPYADREYYENSYEGRVIPTEDRVRCLKQASRHINSLTYNRIVGRGFSNLTEFQQDIIKEVCCMQAEFEYENADEIDSILSSYSINGVSAQFGNSWNTHVENGVCMKKDVYSMLCQTGLCCRLAV